MRCLKCNKTIIAHRGELLDSDGGVIITLTCENCKSKFEAFVSPIEFEEQYDVIDDV